jgi:hypothetical protein
MTADWNEPTKLRPSELGIKKEQRFFCIALSGFFPVILFSVGCVSG